MNSKMLTMSELKATLDIFKWIIYFLHFIDTFRLIWFKCITISLITYQSVSQIIQKKFCSILSSQLWGHKTVFPWTNELLTMHQFTKIAYLDYMRQFRLLVDFGMCPDRLWYKLQTKVNKNCLIFSLNNPLFIIILYNYQFKKWLPMKHANKTNMPHILLLVCSLWSCGFIH